MNRKRWNEFPDKPAWLDRILQVTATTKGENSPKEQNVVGEKEVFEGVVKGLVGAGEAEYQKIQVKTRQR